MLRVVRLLHQESLDDTAFAIGSVKGHLSELERFGGRHTSKNLKAKLARHYGAKNFAVLTKTIDGKKLARILLDSVKLDKAANHA